MSTDKKIEKNPWDIYNNDIDVATIGEYLHDERYYLRSKQPSDVVTQNVEDAPDYWGFRCFVYPKNWQNKERAYYDITDAISEITWSDDLASAAMECDLKVWDALDNQKPSRELSHFMTKGSRISFYVKNRETNKLKMINNFVIWELSRGSARDPYVSFRCYDSLIYLLKSEDAYLFTKKTSPGGKGWTAETITREICKKYSIPTGSIARAKHRIPYFRVDGGSVWDVILKAWTEERDKTNVRYVIRMENNKLTVRPKQTKRTFWGVIEKENLIDISFTDSLEDMATVVRAIAPAEESGGAVSTNAVAAGGELPEEALEDKGGLRPSDDKRSSIGPTSVTQTTHDGWKVTSASWFDVGKETALAYGDSPSSTLKCFAELSNNHTDPDGPWDFSALGNLPKYTEIEVKYNNKIIKVKKMDVGRGGGPAPGARDRGIDLSIPSFKELTGLDHKKKGLVKVEWRLAGSGAAKVETNTNSENADVPGAQIYAVNKEAIKTYGYIQKLLTLNAGTKESALKQVAVNALNESGRDNYDAEVETFLIPFLRAGDPIYVRDSGTGLRGRYYCSDVTHSISASGCRTNIGLNWLDIVPSLEMEKEAKEPPRPPQQPGSMPGSVVGGALPTQNGCGPCPGGSWGGGPGQGTHSFQNLPNNWQSDNAWDIFGPDGTPCIAVEDCVVEKVGNFNPDPGYWGIAVTVRCKSDGNRLFYQHLKAVADGIRVGAVLYPRQIIGYLGTGVNGGPHLHFGSEKKDPGAYRNSACGGTSGALPGTTVAVGDAAARTQLHRAWVDPNMRYETIDIKQKVASNAGPVLPVVFALSDQIRSNDVCVLRVDGKSHHVYVKKLNPMRAKSGHQMHIPPPLAKSISKNAKSGFSAAVYVTPGLTEVGASVASGVVADIKDILGFRPV